MTSSKPTSAKTTFRKTLLTLAAVSMMAPAMVPSMAQAGDTTTNAPHMAVKTTSNAYVKLGVKAYKNGEFDRSIAFHKRALNDGLSKSRRAIAQSNLCASYAAIGDMEAATEACDAALELKPGYELAVANKSALTVLLAQK